MSDHIHDEQVEGRFPGMKAWIFCVGGVVWISSWLQVWADDQMLGRLPDLTLFFLGRPLILLAALVFGLQIWSWALRIRIKEALVTGWRWLLGLLLLPTLINLGLRLFGFSVQSWSYVAGKEWLLSLVSGGWYPRPIASPGVLVTLMLSAWFVGWTVWKWREEKTRALIMGLVTYGAFAFFLSIPSVIAWMGMDGGVSWWNSSGYAVQRGMILLSNQQYWWRSLYERFPGSTGGEAEASESLLFVVLAYLFLGGTAIWFKRKELLTVIRERLQRPREVVGSTPGVSVAAMLFGLFLGLNTLVGGVKIVIFVCALLIALLILGSYSALLSKKISFLEEERWFFWAFVGIGAWLLGWPVAMSLLTAAICRQGDQFLRKIGYLPVVQGLFSGGVFLALFLAAWMFGSQKGSFEEIGVAAFLGFAFFFWVHELAIRFRLDPSMSYLGSMKTIQERIGLEKGSSILILLSYLVLPLTTRWFSWFLLVLPVGAIAALLSFGRKESFEKQLRGVMIAFLLVSYFFLSVRGFHS
jgi:hypothetical protein